jgi:hypothetical protein
VEEVLMRSKWHEESHSPEFARTWQGEQAMLLTFGKPSYEFVLQVTSVDRRE